jgi:hypothetical protein
MYPAAYASVMPAGSSLFLAPVQYGSSNAPETATFGVTNNVIRWGDYSSAVADPAAANSFVVSNEIVPSAQNISNNAPWGTVTATITLSRGTSGAVFASSSKTSPTSSNTPSTSSSYPVLLTADDHHGAHGPALAVASLDAANLPVFDPVANIENPGGRNGSREFSHDPHSPASLNLLVNYMAAFAGSRDGYSGTPMVDSTTVTTNSLILTNPHA